MRLRNALGTLAVTAALVTSGCNGAASKAAPSPPASTSPSASGSGSSSPSTDSTVAPATGRLMSTSDATVNAPKGWTTVSAKTYNYLTLTAPDGINGVTLSDFGTVSDADTEKYVRQTVRDQDPKNPEVEPADLGAAPGVHLRFEDGQFDYDVYGAILENTFVYVMFTQYVDVPAAKQQQVIDSVLASFRWK